LKACLVLIEIYTCSPYVDRLHIHEWCVWLLYFRMMEIYLLWLIEKWYHAWCDGWIKFIFHIYGDMHVVICMRWCILVFMCVCIIYISGWGEAWVAYVCAVFIRGWENINSILGCHYRHLWVGGREWIPFVDGENANKSIPWIGGNYESDYSWMGDYEWGRL